MVEAGKGGSKEGRGVGVGGGGGGLHIADRLGLKESDIIEYVSAEEGAGLVCCMVLE